MLLRFEISCVLAASPRYLLFGPNPTRDLKVHQYGRAKGRVGDDLRCSSIGDLICDLVNTISFGGV